MTKKFTSMFLALAMCLSLSVYANQTAGEALAEEQYTDTLAAYMEGLGKIYVTDMAQTFSAGEPLTDVEQQWKLHIAEWANDVEISILTQKSDFTIKEVISENDTEVKLLVYVWTNLEYENDGYPGVVEEMGFGIDHIFTLAKTEDNDFLVLDDCFIDEKINYYSGCAESFELLLETNMIDEGLDESEMIPLAVILPNNMPLYPSYKPADAIAYSDKWAGPKNEGGSISQTPTTYNPEYYYYSADCANFVSQCMLEGGMPQSTSTKDDGWWVKKNTTGSTTPAGGDSSKSGEAWRRVSIFEKYWTGQGCVSIPLDSKEKAVPGNPMYELTATTGHLMFIVGVNPNGKIIYNAHNKDEYHVLRSPSSGLKTIDFIHDFSNTTYTEPDLYSHTITCGICSGRSKENHTWADAKPSGYYCTVCGYKSNIKPEIINKVEGTE